MLTRIFWIPEVQPNRLAIMPRPQGGDELVPEVTGWCEQGIDVVVSLLEPMEVGFLALDKEDVLCQEAGIEFLTFPIGDRGLPRDLQQTKAFVNGIVERLRKGKSVAIHCRVGIGRSGLIAGCTLLHLGFAYPEVFPVLARARGMDVPDTREQAHWVEAYARGLVE